MKLPKSIPLVAALSLFIAMGGGCFSSTPVATPTPNPVPTTPPVATPPTESVHVQADDRISVTSPLPNAHVASPLTVTGQAKGTWYFEASFPVRVEDAQGNVLARTTAQAQGDWMTENFVPFTATLTFTPTTTTGWIVLQRDNPSGLPENEADLWVPVTF